MLLDIEMPRVSKYWILYDIMICINTCHDYVPNRWKTSRTSILIRQYMGKPFQEEELLENIDA